MKNLYFFKYPLAVFMTGFLVQFVGGLFKIRHWPNADELITIGIIIGGAGICWGIIKLLLLKKPE